jgi:membrane protein insertase Oxa1/YidC/SpoIIIJ
MVEKVPSLKGGGALWFTDLTTPDSLYILPVLTGLTALATVEVCTLSISIQSYDCPFVIVNLFGVPLLHS